MTPFGIQLVLSLKARHKTQSQLARDLGVHHTYLSSVIHGRKGMPSSSLVKAISDLLGLSESENKLLNHAAIHSCRQITLPASANLAERELVGQLVRRMGHLVPAQISAMKCILDIPGGHTPVDG